MKNYIMTIALFILYIGSGYAQVPRGINYQAVARHSDGTPFTDQDISVRISLLTGGVDGEVEYRETHFITTNDYGLFSLVIGHGSSNMQFASLDWSAPEGKWIQVEIDPHANQDFILIGSQQLFSVPYSFYADIAGKADPVLKFLSQEEIDQLDTPQAGMMVWNTSTDELNIYGLADWYSISTEKIIREFTCGGLLVDSRDQQSYKTTQVGSQCWMAENLNVGTQINGASDQTDNGTIEKYCYQNNEAGGCGQYGGLYQWDELMNYTNVKGSRGICPEGWHIPTDYEVQALEIALGMSNNDAGLSNIWRGTDQGLKIAPGGSSGFDVLYSGRRVSGGLYTAVEQYEYLWTSTESVDYAWRRCFQVNNGKIGRYDTFPKSYGMSVRCLKD